MIKHLITRIAALCLGGFALPSLAADYTLTQETTHIVPATRGTLDTTHFGWDDLGTTTTLIDDTTPDLGVAPPVGVRFRTTNGADHASGTGNFYSYSTPPAEEVTVVTSGTPGATGKTTIIVQMVTLFGGFGGQYILSPINGVAPTVVQGTNKAGKGQLWARWVLDGNAVSYTFNISGAEGTSAYSFDKIEVDTFFSETQEQGDSMILAEPAALASTLDQLPGITAPSSRDTRSTTFFGWDTFGPAGPATVIDDSTPDIGTDPTGLARFHTMNGEKHQFSGGGNLYLLSFTPPAFTLDEQITVPTKGIVGTAGFTTVILQIASASSGMGGANFADEIFLRPINGVTPTVVQGDGSSSALLWAKWEIPGNEATYTIDIDGVPNQDHYSFDKVTVDTKYSRYGHVGDTMKENTVEILTEVLADATRNEPFSVQLEAEGGALPHTWSLYVPASGQPANVLPAGLTLSPEGLLSGTPTTLGQTTFTVVATAATGGYKNNATYAFRVLPLLNITTASLPEGLVGQSYSATLEAAGSPAPYQWAVVSGSTLPPGLGLGTNGVLSGNPTAVGNYSVTFSVMDAEAFPVTRTLVIPVFALTKNYVLNLEAAPVVVTTRGAPHSTHFGWDYFGVISTPIDDTTPDIGANPPGGVRFKTTNGADHSSGSGNYYSYGTPPSEEVTVVTNGTPGATGKTTIMVQMVTLFGPFGGDFIISPINGVEPTVVQGLNSAGKGQLWARWVLDGNAPSYAFTLSGAEGTSAYSFDKLEVDTFWSPTGKTGDKMGPAEAAPLASIMDQLPGVVTPSSRGSLGSTYFGWDTYGVAGPAAIIDDSTPDIGADPTGLARFQTLNGEKHQFSGNSNLYVFNATGNATLNEQITVPTDGVVGPNGFTTIILQIASAGTPAPNAIFSGPITVGSINGIAPTVVQGSGANVAQLWAKWQIPGNQAAYTITIDGVPDLQHYSFDKVVVDTKFSSYAYVGDTMKAQTVEITAATLADATKGVAYEGVQLAATGGTGPYAWTVKSGSTLPAGLTLSSAGVISGTPEVLGEFTFDLTATSTDSYQASATYELTILPGLVVTSTGFSTGVVGLNYSATLIASGGPSPYTWAAADLPAGLSLSPTTGEITGIPTAAGTPSVTFTVTDGDGSTASKAIQLVIVGSRLAPDFAPVVFTVGTIGAPYSHTLSAGNYPEKFTITGLPKGLTYKNVTVASGPTTAEISGSATVAGAFPVQVRATNAGGTVTRNATLVIKALASHMVGSFTGLVERNAVNTNLGSSFTLTTTTGGKFTVQVKTGATTKSATGNLLASAPQVKVQVGTAELKLTIATDGLVSGTHGTADINGWRIVWDAKLQPASVFEGYYSAAIDLDDEADSLNPAIPHGVGYATFSVAPSGVLKVTGKTADGQALVSSTTLGPDGQIAVYAPQYANKGSAHGKWVITEDEDGFANNDITGVLTWHKPVTTGRMYPAAFVLPVKLTVAGGYLGATAKEPLVLALPETGLIDLDFVGAGVEASATNPDVTGITWNDSYTAVMPLTGNAAKAALKINKSTGAVSGTVNFAETTPVLLRKAVKFEGQVVKLPGGDVKAAGFILVPQIPTGIQKATTSPILSGAFYISQTPVEP